MRPSASQQLCRRKGRVADRDGDSWGCSRPKMFLEMQRVLFFAKTGVGCKTLCGGAFLDGECLCLQASLEKLDRESKTIARTRHPCQLQSGLCVFIYFGFHQKPSTLVESTSLSFINPTTTICIALLNAGTKCIPMLVHVLHMHHHNNDTIFTPAPSAHSFSKQSVASSQNLDKSSRSSE